AVQSENGPSPRELPDTPPIWMQAEGRGFESVSRSRPNKTRRFVRSAPPGSGRYSTAHTGSQRLLSDLVKVFLLGKPADGCCEGTVLHLRLWRRPHHPSAN